jgi:tRNA-uridine 2-sulfurtransferase
MKDTIAVAVSGGIDSLVAAYLLKQAGHDVLGVHFVTGYESLPEGHAPQSVLSSVGPASSRDNRIRHKMDLIADQLGIRIEIIDLSAEFQKRVVDYFTHTYQAGRTPNPCLVCNPAIKFDLLAAQAEGLGAGGLATGHYARRSIDSNGRWRLLKARDPAKDQSYFLARLTQAQLAKASFPLGGMLKSETVQLARMKKLKAVTQAESQDVCFIQNGSYAEFLRNRQDLATRPGLIEDVCGKVLGQHPGLHRFTIGQRRGINCPAAEPYYVVRIDIRRNRLIVGFKADLLSFQCRVNDINWIGEIPGSQLRLATRVRYRHQEVASTLTPIDAVTAMVRFDEPQAAIAPGQGAVFYRDNEVLGGGFIDEPQ